MVLVSESATNLPEGTDPDATSTGEKIIGKNAGTEHEEHIA